MLIKSFEDYKEENKFDKNADVKAQRIPWYGTVMNQMQSNGRQPNVSPLQIWYFEEKRKQQLGLQNEIDINEIKAAAKGVLNKWSAKLKANPGKFTPVIESRTDYVWQDIISN